MELLRSTRSRYSGEGRRESLKRIAFVAELAVGSHVHLSGICGTGMASVAGLLRELGFRVTGSDKAFYPPMGEVVRGLADRLYDGYRASNLDERPALVVIGNNLSADNPEVLRAMEAGINYASMPEVFSALLVGSREHCPCSVVVIGTHGKTTTTAGIATLFDQAGRKPGYFVGGVPNDLPAAVRAVAEDIDPSKRVVVLEGDEYDSAFFARWPKFHSYRPDILVVTSLEFDHADIYSSVVEIEREFSDIAAQVPEDGCILLCDTYDRLRRLADYWAADKLVKAPVLFYGEQKTSPFRLVKREASPAADEPGQTLQLRFEQEDGAVLKTSLTGGHNALNLTAAAAVGLLRGLEAGVIVKALSDFTGVKRRQQSLGEFGGVLVIEDFAHHPTAVWTTLQGLRESYPARRIVAAFEPRSNTARRAFFQEDFAFSFGLADVVFIKEIQDAGSFSLTNSTIVPLDVKRLINEIAAQETEAFAVASFDEMKERLIGTARPGDLIVLMSNGDFGGLPGAVPAALKEKFGA